MLLLPFFPHHWSFDTYFYVECVIIVQLSDFHHFAFLNHVVTELPYNDYFEYFGPDFKLHISPSNMTNQNTQEYMDKIKYVQSRVSQHLGWEHKYLLGLKWLCYSRTQYFSCLHSDEGLTVMERQQTIKISFSLHVVSLADLSLKYVGEDSVSQFLVKFCFAGVLCVDGVKQDPTVPVMLNDILAAIWARGTGFQQGQVTNCGSTSCGQHAPLPI